MTVNLSSIILYSLVTSPYAMKVHCYLLYKSLNFSVVYVNPTSRVKQLPIGHQVPVLSIGDQSKSESSLIGHWLDDRFPDSLPILPTNIAERTEVIKQDNWVTDVLIPMVFYSIYPKINQSIVTQYKNALYLGKCVGDTCEPKLSKGMQLLWPLIIHQSGFIKQIVHPLIKKGSVAYCRKEALNALEKKLSHHEYLAHTHQPSLADLSAFPMITVPYQLGMQGTGDFLDYPHIIRWVKQMSDQLNSDGLPPLIDKKYIRNTI